MDEIVSLEKMVQKFVVDNEGIENEVSILQTKVDNLAQENEVLVLKINELEKKLNSAENNIAHNTKTSLDFSERENLKNQIDDLITKIDYHIQS